MTADYGTTRGDVDELLVWSVDASTTPLPAAIDQWIVLGAAELHARLGDLDGSCDDDGFTSRARYVVALFAAAMAEDAHYPERALDKDQGHYGAVLWRRWRELTDALVRDVEACRDGAGGGRRGGASHGFPATPLFTRDVGT